MVRVRYSFSSRRTGNLKNIHKQREKYPHLVNEVIEQADIIVEVLDARFLPEMKNFELEEKIKQEGKKLILVANKADLVNKEELELKIPKELAGVMFVSCRVRQGISKLREKIKILARRAMQEKSSDEDQETEGFEHQKLRSGEKRDNRIKVGVIGYPNTGKSSLINILAGTSAAKTSQEPGFTRSLQKIRLTNDIVLLDTPGVIPESEYSHVKKEAIQKQTTVGARSYDRVKDPEMVVHYLLQNKDYAKAIEDFYKIQANGNSEILIEELGKQRNMLRKGGEIDGDRTARIILKDWQKGNIRF